MKRLGVLLVFVFGFLLTGCYWFDEVKPHEVGVHVEGGEIRFCKPPGVHTSNAYWADLVHISGEILTFEFADPSVATKDTQIVGVTLTVQARRKTDCESAKSLLTDWINLIDDAKLIETIGATGGEATKNGTRQFTLNQLLDDRNGLANAIQEALSEDSARYNVEIVNVIVEDVAVDPEYETYLKEKALLTVQIETQERRQDLITAQAEADKLEQVRQTEVLLAQLERERAETDVQVEVASREGEKIEAEWRVYLLNPQAAELRKLELLQGVLGDKAQFWFIEPGTDLTQILLHNADELKGVVP